MRGRCGVAGAVGVTASGSPRTRNRSTFQDSTSTSRKACVLIASNRASIVCQVKREAQQQGDATVFAILLCEDTNEQSEDGVERDVAERDRVQERRAILGRQKRSNRPDPHKGCCRAPSPLSQEVTHGASHCSRWTKRNPRESACSAEGVPFVCVCRRSCVIPWVLEFQPTWSFGHPGSFDGNSCYQSQAA